MLVAEEKNKTKYEELVEYRNSNAINQSKLKEINSGYIKRKKPSLNMLLGSNFDCRLTSLELFDDLFMVYEGKRASEVICSIVEHVYTNLRKNPNCDVAESLESYTEYITQALVEIPFQSNWKTDTRLAAIIRDGSEYFKLLKVKGDRELVTQKEVDDADATILSLWENNPSAEILNKVTHWQLPLYAYYKDTLLKGLLDCVCIDDENYNITITDVKRTDFVLSESSLKSVIKKFGYNFQLAFYKYLVEQNFSGYEVKCQILFVSSFSGKSALVPLSEIDLEIGKSGVTKLNSQYYNDFLDKVMLEEIYHPGWIDLLNIYLQSVSLGIDDYNLDYYVKEGVFNFESIYK